MPNRLKYNLEQIKVYCKAMQGDGWFMTPRSPNLPEGFWQSIFKSLVKEEVAESAMNSCTVL